MRYLPQEIEVWYIIPAIRREMSSCLIKDYKVSYEKVGRILGVSKAAVSQYLKGKRAAKIKLPKEVKPKIMASCKTLSKDKGSSVEEITKILKFIRDKNLPCEVCGTLRGGILEDCREIRLKNI